MFAIALIHKKIARKNFLKFIYNSSKISCCLNFENIVEKVYFLN